MTHLKIEQSVGQIEYVTDSVVEKLYELVTNSTLDNESNLQGTIHIDTGYRDHVNAITANYPDFHVQADNYAILFEDPKIITYLNSIGIGSNGIVTEAQATAATVVANSANTEVTKFNELKYFTNITESKGGWTAYGDGYARFYNWTALEEVDISNFTSLGHNNGYGWADTFKGCTSLKKVIASDKLTKIGWSAFDGCSNLEEITGLSGTITLASGAFSGCAKLDSSCFDDVEFIINEATSPFSHCTTITSIALSDESTAIGITSFYNDTALTTVSGGNNITSIGTEAFKECSSLTSYTIPATVTSIGNSAFNGCSSLVIDNLSLPNLTSLGAAAFLNTRIKSVSNLGSITSIPDVTFNGCVDLTSVSIPNTVTSIGIQSFFNCTSLTSITIPNSVTSIGREVFKNCSSLTSATIPGNITSLPEQCFFGCTNLYSINIPDTVVSIGNTIFANCSSLTNIGTNLLNIETIGNNVFEGCSNISSLNTINFPNLEAIGTASFKDCTQIQHITSLGIITSLTSEWPNQTTFYRCTGLLDVVLPETLTTIGLYGFVECSNIRYIKILATSVPTYNLISGWGYAQPYGVFFGESYRNDDVTGEYIGYTYPIYVQDSLLEEYKIADGWKYVGACSNGYNLNLTERLKPLSQFATDFPNE